MPWGVRVPLGLSISLGTALNSSGGQFRWLAGYVYDFENRLIQTGDVTYTYDGDGNRISKTVSGVTTKYLVDTQNPTGYPQVLEEIPSNPFPSYYVYGLEQISRQRQFYNPTLTTEMIYYVHDGHGSVCALTNPSGAVTDTYDYDAFGNLIHSSTARCADSSGIISTVALGAACPTGSSPAPTPNNYLFAGEQFDPDLDLYYNRARYLNTTMGRFWTMDSAEGSDNEPLSLHKYLFAQADPVDYTDSSGNEVDEIGNLAVINTLDGSPGLDVSTVMSSLFNIPAPTYNITENFVRKGKAIGFYKEFDLAFTVQPSLINRYMIVQWVKGRILHNGTPTLALHQGEFKPVSFSNWEIVTAACMRVWASERKAPSS